MLMIDVNIKAVKKKSKQAGAENQKPTDSATLAVFISLLIQAYILAAENWEGICPNCGRSYTKHGSYFRKTPLIFGGFFIRRVICKTCKVTHALIPRFLIPYGRFRISEMELVIRPGAARGCTIEQLAELIKTEPSTISRWKSRLSALAPKLILSLSERLGIAPSDPKNCFENGFLDPPEQIVFRLAGLLQEKEFPRFPYPDLALINLVFPITKMVK